jgi:hypothetical protein
MTERADQDHHARPAAQPAAATAVAADGAEAVRDTSALARAGALSPTARPRRRAPWWALLAAACVVGAGLGGGAARLTASRPTPPLAVTPLPALPPAPASAPASAPLPTGVSDPLLPAPGTLPPGSAPRVGLVAAVEDDTLVLTTPFGEQRVPLAPDTRVQEVVTADRSALQPGQFVAVSDAAGGVSVQILSRDGPLSLGERLMGPGLLPPPGGALPPPGSAAPASPPFAPLPAR